MIFNRKFLWIFTILLFALSVRADHLAGGSMTYKLLDPQNGVYEIQLTIVRPCDKGTLPSSVSITMQNCANQIYKTSMNLVSSSQIRSQCDLNNSNCLSNSAFQKNIYKGTVFIGRQCGYRLVYFEDNYRSISNTLSNVNEKLYLQVIINTNYDNQGPDILAIDEYNQFLVNDKVYKLYNIRDVDGDSVVVSLAAPLNAANTSSIFQPYSALFVPPLNSNKPLFVSEAQINYDESLNSISFTPNVVFKGWLTKKIKEYRRIKTNLGIDSVIMLGETIHEEYIRIVSSQDPILYEKTTSTNPNVKIQNQTVTICRTDQSVEFETRIIVPKSIKSYKDTVIPTNANSVNVTSTRNIGNGIYDTIVYKFQTAINQTDQNGCLKFQVMYCDQLSQSISKQFVIDIHWLQSKVFKKDSMKICTQSDSVVVMLLNSKSIVFSQGMLRSSDMLEVYPSSSGYIYAAINSPNPQCPALDSIYLLKGDKIATQWVTRPTSCFLSQDGFAQVICSGLGNPYTFHWPDHSTSDSNNNLAAGTYKVTIVDKNQCSITPSISILQPDGIQSTWIVDSVITCHGDSNAVGHFSFRTLRPNSILWQGNLTSDTVFNHLKAKIYSGSFRYLNSFSNTCIQPFDVEIIQPDSVLFSTLTKDLTCSQSNDGIIAINPSGGNHYYKYYVNNIEMAISSIYGLSPGGYPIYVKDIKGCLSSIKTVVIDQPSMLTPLLQTTMPSCLEVANGQLKIPSVIGAQGNISVLLNSNSSPNNEYSGLKAFVNYQLHIEDKLGCFFDTTLVLSPLYQVNHSVIDLKALTCANIHNGTLQFKVMNGLLPYHVVNAYQNKVYKDTILITGLDKGTYQITVKDSNECPTVVQCTIPSPPNPNIQPVITRPSCFGYSDGSIKLSISGATPPYSQYQWNTFPVSSSLDLLNIDSGTYIFDFVDANNCIFSDTFTVPSAPFFGIEIVEQKPASCFNASDAILKPKIIGGTPSFLYRWNYAQYSKDSIYFNASPLKVYELDVYAQDGCIFHASYQPKNPPQIMLEQIKLKPVTCPENSDGIIDVQAKGGYPFANGRYQYALSSLEFKDRGQFINLFSGHYYLLVKDSQNCVIGDSITLDVEKQIILNLDSTYTELEPGQSIDMLKSPYFKNILLSDIKKIRWTPMEGVSCYDCFHPSITPYKTTEYTLEVIYGNMCKTSAKTWLRVKSINEVFIPNSFSPNRDGINDTWKIFGKYIGGFYLEVHNRWGEKVFSTNNSLFEWTGEYKGVLLPSDEYIYHMDIQYLDGRIKKYSGVLNLFR